MASSYSSKFRFELIGTGDQSGTWGATTDGTIGTMLEQALGGVGGIVFGADTDRTLTLANGAVDEARNAIYVCTSSVSLTAPRSLILPAGIGVTKLSVVYNLTTGGQPVVIKPSGGSGVSVPSGNIAFVYSDGTNCTQVGVQSNPSTGAISLGPTTITGAVTMSSTLALAGDFAIASTKFNVDAATGNTLIAGTLGVTGAVAIAAVGSATAPPLRIGSEQSGLYYQTAGYLHVAAAGVLSASFRYNGDFTAVGNVYFSSDRRLKTKLRRVREPLDMLKQLKAYRYEKKALPGMPQLGLIAQDAQLADAALATDGPDGMLTLNVGGVLALAVDCINALEKRLAQVEARRG
jgi:hypothetical protein